MSRLKKTEFSIGVESPLRGRYLVRNRPLRLALAGADWLVSRGGGGAEPAPLARPRRLLLAAGGHLGDVVIATSAVRALRELYPDVEIGMLVGSWARPVVEGHPELRWVHTVDHWKLNRGGAGRAARFARYRSTRTAALRQIRGVGYDTAIDLYPFFPNSAALLWRARIPVRIGYVSGGLGPLFTHALAWENSDRPVAEYHADLLRLLPGAGEEEPGLAPLLPPVSSRARASVESRLEEAGAAPGSYVVLHAGSGSELKEWPLDRWQALVTELDRQGHRLVFTGAGATETANAERLAASVGGHSLSGKLRWEEFVHALACARLVISIDSVAGHVAAAVGTPVAVIMGGMSNPHHWRPLGPASRIVTNPVPCAPCYRSRGCATMDCVRGVPVRAVLSAASELLQDGVPLGPLDVRMENA